MTALDLGVIAVAAWRLALFLVDDVGPFDAADRFRRLIRADLEVRRQKLISLVNRDLARSIGTAITEDTVHLEPNGWEKLWSCMRCMSAWTALLLAGIWQLETWPVQLLAIWGLAQIVENARQMRL